MQPITHGRLDAALMVTTAGGNASDSLDLLQAGGLDNITLWLKRMSGSGGTVTIEQSDDGATWTDYVSVTIGADDEDSYPFRAPAGTARFVRISAGVDGIRLAVGV